MPGKTATAMLALSAALAVSHTAAKPTFPSKIPNGSNVKGVAALGHKSTSGGGALNAFGEAFDSAGLSWTKELCEADSDGDGQTNGQELGDPCCKWVEGSNEKVQWTTGVSHPGDASSKSDASLWASISCSSASSSSATSSKNSTTTAATTAPGAATKAPATAASTAPTTATTTPAPTTSGASTASVAAASLALATVVAASFA